MSLRLLFNPNLPYSQARNQSEFVMWVQLATPKYNDLPGILGLFISDSK